MLKVEGLSFFGFAGGCGAGTYIFCPFMRYEIWLGVLCRTISIKPEVYFVHSVLSPLVHFRSFEFFFSREVIRVEPHQTDSVFPMKRKKYI